MEDVRRIAEVIDPHMDMTRTGDVHPSDYAAVLSGRAGRLYAGDMSWGFSRVGKHMRMINGRTDSVLSKPSYSESVLRRRCVIPAGHFYEWDRNKTKISFKVPAERTMYMAGFYDVRENQEQFVIMTTEANASMLPVHDRMPLILSEGQIRDWIFRDDLLGVMMKQASPMLESWQEYEQLSLF